MDAPLWMPTGMAVAITVNLYLTLARHAIRSMRGAVTGIRWDDEEGLSLQRKGVSDWSPAAIRSRFVHPWLIVLSIGIPGHRIPASLVLAADALEPEAFRRLRAALLAPHRTRAE